MAAFLTANRWESGVGTHKTKQGRILCTGAGCIGCFPEINKSEAKEIGVQDLDLSVHPFRPWLNDDDVAKQLTSKKSKRKKVQARNITSISSHETISFQPVKKPQVRDVETQTFHNNEELHMRNAGLSTRTRNVLFTMLRPDNPIRNDYYSTEDRELSAEIQLQTPRELNKKTKEHFNGNYSNTSRDRNVKRNVNKTTKIFENFYIIPTKHTAINPDESLDGREKSEYSPWDEGEDAVCLYFAIEYFNSERVLPDFKVLEIVEALTDVMPARQVKCVQVVAGIWQIVLRTRRYLSYLRQLGLKIRGRVYQLVEDCDSYCKVIYDDERYDKLLY